MFYSYYILLRSVDLITTYRGLTANNALEMNPFTQALITNMGLIPMMLINALLSLCVLWIFIKTRHILVSRIVLYGFLLMNTLVASTNMWVVFHP